MTAHSPQPSSSDRYSKVSAFARTALPPLLSRYALKGLRVAAMTPAGRAIMLFILAGLLALLIVPAVLLALLTLLATGDAAVAAVVGLVVLAVAFAAELMGLLYLRRRWKKFKRQYAR